MTEQEENSDCLFLCERKREEKIVLNVKRTGNRRMEGSRGGMKTEEKRKTEQKDRKIRKKKDRTKR